MSRAKKSDERQKGAVPGPFLSSFKPQRLLLARLLNFVQAFPESLSALVRKPGTIHEMLGSYLWRQRLKFEATLGFCMLEPWEKFLFMFIFTFFALLLVSGLYRCLPQHVSIMRQRATYYLWGQDGDDRLLRHLVDSTLKEL